MVRDLHDHAGQYFVGIMLRLAALELLTTDCNLLASLRELHTTVIRFRDDVRAICAGQRRGVPRGNALMTALAHLIPQWEQEVGIAARFDQDVEDSSEFDDATAEAVFRVVQEALTNVAKHASHASQVSISLHLKPQLEHRMLRLEIEDDGLAKASAKGSSRSAAKRACSGIAGMRERIAELGGSFEVRQQMGKGTSIVAMIPINQVDRGIA
jgi:NarL family two-component system sensor histidine kinase LiaS